MTQHPDAQGVDERIAVIGGVEEGLAADRGQAEAVAIVGDPRNNTGQHTCGIWSIQRAESQSIHDADRASAHRHDVANDATDSGSCALVGLDVGGVVVGLRLKSDGQSVANIDDTSIVPDAS